MIAALAGTALFAAASARWNWWRPSQKGLAVLMYHHLGDPPRKNRHDALWVRENDFAQQLKKCLDWGWSPLLFSELAAGFSGERPLPEKPLLVSFDDGTADNFELAFPILEKLKVKANIFVAVSGVGEHTRWEDPNRKPWLRMLSWEQMRAMSDSGIVEFGSHTMNHPNLAALRPDEVSWELSESKKRLEEGLLKPVIAFAYPFGSGARDASLREKVKTAGYSLDFSVRQGLNPVSWSFEQGALKRLYVRRDDFLLDLNLNLTRGRARL